MFMPVKLDPVRKAAHKPFCRSWLIPPDPTKLATVGCPVPRASIIVSVTPPETSVAEGLVVWVGAVRSKETGAAKTDVPQDTNDRDASAARPKLFLVAMSKTRICRIVDATTAFVKGAKRAPARLVKI